MNYKEQIINSLLENSEKKFTKVSLRSPLNIKEGDTIKFNKCLHELVKDNVVIKTKKDKYFINKRINLFIGKFIYNKKGFGFCIRTGTIQENELTEVFIPPHLTKNALHEDIVIVKINNISKNKLKSDGEIISILERRTSIIVGTFIKDEHFGFVIPDNPKFNMDIYVPEGKSLTAKSYDKVLVKITTYPFKDKKPVGEIKEVIGFYTDTGIDYLSLIKDYGLTESFSAKTIHQTDRLSEQIEQCELKKRTDLSDMCIFSIDGEDAKDLDDAISIEKINNCYRLGVHIADVTHYIKEDSPLDKEALSRGTSIYLINKVIPMLPKKLSNNLCSLNPFEDKLTLSVFMNINTNGDILSHEIMESYISSKSKLCYYNVSDFIENNAELNCDKRIKNTEMEDKLKESLMLSKELSLILKQKRVKRGALDFQFDENKIILDVLDKPIEVKIYERTISNNIIEEFMVITNEVIAKKFNDMNIPFLYRVHEKPKPEKLICLMNFIQRLDYTLPEDYSQKSLQLILNQAIGKNEEMAVNLLLLQSMQQARYYQAELGHFGLGAEYYSHFTSPIRRYPDLQIHRIIKDSLNGRLNSVKIERYKKKVENAAVISSRRERQAQNIEIEYDNIKKAEYMQDKINQEFEGIIRSVSTTVCKILLPNSIEGILSIKDDYVISQEGCSVINNEKECLTIGDKVKVRISKVIVPEALIIFKLVK